MKNADFYRTTFLAMMNGGKSAWEAFQEFDGKDFNRALVEELSSSNVHVNPKTFTHETLDGLPSLLTLSSWASREKMNEEDTEKAIELWMAGWTSEADAKTQKDVMSWYWRRPSKRPGKLGRKFHSTNQAFMALRRERIK